MTIGTPTQTLRQVSENVGVRCLTPTYGPWSSYQINALGKLSDLCTPHPEYLGLGKTQHERMENYRALFSCHVEGELLEDIRLSLNKGMVIGHDRFNLTSSPKPL